MPFDEYVKLRTAAISIPAVAILLLLVVPMVHGSSNLSQFSNSRTLSSTSPDPGSYSENLVLYTTSAQSLWMADLVGGNINIGIAIPSSVSTFTVSLTHYDNWTSKYEVFTTHGFGYLGKDEPMPNESLLEVTTTSQSDAASLASSLGQKFGLNYVLYTSNSTTYSFISPMNFATVMHIYFWNLLPHSAGGFANITTEQDFESRNLVFFKVFYSGGAYSIAYGAIQSVSSSSSFSLYSQLGVSHLNYSSSATSSSLEIHVLGGLVTNSTIKPNNSFQNFSSLITTSKPSSGNLTVPNISASLDFAFPTIIAYRQVSPLNPSTNENVSVSITVKDVSPSGTPKASVAFNDSSWYAGLSETGPSSKNYTISPGQSNTTIYFVKAPNSTKNIFIPATPLTYSFKAANQTVVATTFLNNETMLVGASGPAALEIIENVNSPAIQAGQPLPVNILIKNWGPGAAASVTIAGHSPLNITSGSSANFTVTAGPTSLTQTGAMIDYLATWTDTTGTHSEGTNSISAVYSFGNPGSPTTTLSKTVSVSKNKSYANITLVLLNGGSNALSNLNITDLIPSGLSFSHTVGNLSKSITASNTTSSVSLKVTNLNASSSVEYEYNATISNPSNNYVFLPGNVSTSWNGQTITHYSQGVGLPLGVSASKSISPNAGFQGTTAVERLGASNNGTLPIYDLSFANSTDSFLSYLNSSKGYTFVLSQGQSVNTTLNLNMTGAPGIYNSSASAATFIFAGANQSASSNVFRVTIYQNLLESMTALGPRIEENHNINISITVDNPSNVTVSNVDYSVNLPTSLKLASGSLSFQISSLGANQTTTRSFEVTTGIPFKYTISGGNLTFQYHGRTLKGVTTPLSLNVVDDLFTRYAIPVFIGLIIVIGTLLYVRRLVRKTS